MKLCTVGIDYVNMDKLQELNGSKFATRAECVAALCECAYTDLPETDPDYLGSLDTNKQAIETSFAWFDNLAELAEELNHPFDCDALTQNHAFFAAEWGE